MTDTVIVERVDGVGVVTLNRPEKLNAWNTPMRESLAASLRELNADADVGAIVVTGAGERAFSAGQDLGETMQFSSGEDGHRWFMSWRGFYDAMRGLDKGCVAALNGVAAGSAFQFAMLTDVRVGHPGTRMGQPEINSGIPSVLGPMLMLSRLGLSRTVELTLSGRMMDGDECHHIGLIHHLVAPSEVMSRSREVAELLGLSSYVDSQAAERRARRAFRAASRELVREYAPGTDPEQELEDLRTALGGAPLPELL